MEQDPKRRADVDAIGWTQDDFTHDLGHGELPEQRVAGHHEPVGGAAGELTKEERARLTILAEGTPLDGGSTYFDLEDPSAGAFTAMDGQSAEPGRASSRSATPTTSSGTGSSDGRPAPGRHGRTIAPL